MNITFDEESSFLLIMGLLISIFVLFVFGFHSSYVQGILICQENGYDYLKDYNSDIVVCGNRTDEYTVVDGKIIPVREYETFTLGDTDD